LKRIEQAERSMKMLRYLTVICLLLVCFVFSATAQKSRRGAPRPTPTPAKPYINPVISVAKMQIENQLFNVNLFVDKMGPVAVAFENADKDAAAGKLKQATADSIEANKKKMIAAIRGLRDPLVALETDFRTKAPLTPYLSSIQGIGSLCSRTEDSAIAGQWVAAKEPLRQIAQKLNETLAVLPGPKGSSTYSPPSSSRTVPVSNSTPNQIKTVNTPVGSTTSGSLKLGMTAAEVLASSWGSPINKRVSNSPNGATEVWTYSGNRTLYFYKGKLSNIVQ
jgi:hypothetical protein